MKKVIFAVLAMGSLGQASNLIDAGERMVEGRVASQKNPLKRERIASSSEDETSSSSLERLAKKARHDDVAEADARPLPDASAFDTDSEGDTKPKRWVPQAPIKKSNIALRRYLRELSTGDKESYYLFRDNTLNQNNSSSTFYIFQ